MNLEKLYIFENQFILNAEQKKWICNLVQNGCDVKYDEDLFERNIIHNNEEIDEDEIPF